MITFSTRQTFLSCCSEQNKTLEIVSDLRMDVHLVCVNCSIAFLPGTAGIVDVCVHIARRCNQLC